MPPKGFRARQSDSDGQRDSNEGTSQPPTKRVRFTPSRPPEGDTAEPTLTHKLRRFDWQTQTPEAGTSANHKGKDTRNREIEVIRKSYKEREEKLTRETSSVIGLEKITDLVDNNEILFKEAFQKASYSGDKHIKMDLERVITLGDSSSMPLDVANKLEVRSPMHSLLPHEAREIIVRASLLRLAELPLHRNRTIERALDFIRSNPTMRAFYEPTSSQGEGEEHAGPSSSQDAGDIAQRQTPEAGTSAQGALEQSRKKQEGAQDSGPSSSQDAGDIAQKKRRLLDTISKEVLTKLGRHIQRNHRPLGTDLYNKFQTACASLKLYRGFYDVQHIDKAIEQCGEVTEENAYDFALQLKEFLNKEGSHFALTRNDNHTRLRKTMNGYFQAAGLSEEQA